MNKYKYIVWLQEDYAGWFPHFCNSIEEIQKVIEQSGITDPLQILVTDPEIQIGDENGSQES